MNAPPTSGFETRLDLLAHRVRRRGWIQGGGVGSLLGGAGAALLLVLHPGWTSPLPVLGLLPIGLLAGVAVGAARVEARFRRAGGARRLGASLAEARIPESRNLIRTAAEHGEVSGPTPLHSPTLAAIVREAEACLHRHPPPRLVPLRDALGRASFQALLSVALLAGGGWVGSPGEAVPVPPAAGGSEARGTPSSLPSPDLPSAEAWEVSVEPPAYRDEAMRRYTSPLQIRALSGSRVRLLPTDGRASLGEGGAVGEAVAAPGAPPPGDGTDATPDEAAPSAGVTPLRLETSRGVQDPTGFELHPDDTYLLLSGHGRPDHLVVLVVEPDPLPRVEVRLPGEDLHLPDGDRVLQLEVEAEDDDALEALELRFLKVTGFGERWSFEEGEIPLEVERVSPTRWRGRAQWDLASLELLRGEAVVYRARARDRRPEGGWSSSDTWAVEILGGGAGVVGGFAGDDETTRYALSQQVVLALTEALEAGADTLAPQALLSEARTLAAAQRRVRAEFVFMLGGELEDEHLHAPDGDDPHAGHDHDHDHPHVHPPGGGGDGDGTRTAQELHEEAHARADADAAEGRLAQEGRIELARAIQWMAAAATFLDAGSLEPALEAEREALDHLQRAFSASRYILRALSERELPDPERRLTGDGTGATGVRLPPPPARSPAWVEGMQRLLSDLHALGLRDAAGKERAPAVGDPGHPTPGHPTPGLPAPGHPTPDRPAPDHPAPGEAGRELGTGDLDAPVPTRIALAADLLRLAGEDPELRGWAPRLVDPETPLAEVMAAVARHLALALPPAPPPGPSPLLRSLQGGWDPGPGEGAR